MPLLTNATSVTIEAVAVADSDFWRLQLHPEVWFTVAAIVAIGVYVVRVLGPLALQGSDPPSTIVTRHQRLYFASGVLLLWMAADWPMHDISEKYLYSVHMVQHLLISFVVPPLLLLATPEWLARLIVLDNSRSATFLRRLCHPVLAAIAFNAVQVLTHWTVAVDWSVRSGAFHYLMHLLVFLTALMMWTPVLGPLKELQISEPAKMVYLFTMSIVPTVPAAWLTFAEGSVYSAYDHGARLWGISVTSDQQAAGVVMKVIGGGYLWTLIAIRFFRWAAAQRHTDEMERRQRQNQLTTVHHQHSPTRITHSNHD